MVYSTRRFVVFPCVILFLCFSVLLVFGLLRLGKRELLLVLFIRSVCACLGLSVSSSSWGLGMGGGGVGGGRDAVCGCGTPSTFLLLFFFLKFPDQLVDKNAFENDLVS